MTERAKVLVFQRKTGIGSERRRFARITEPVEAQVSGTDDGGERFELRATLANLSAGGLYLYSSRSVPPGDQLEFVVRLCMAGRPHIKSPVIAARGVVRRRDSYSDTVYGLAAEFLEHHFL